MFFLSAKATILLQNLWCVILLWKVTGSTSAVKYYYTWQSCVTVTS